MSTGVTQKVCAIGAAALALLAGCSSGSAHDAASSPPTTNAPTKTIAPHTTAAAPSTTSPAATPSQRFEPSLPVALQEGGAAVANGSLYVIAGYDVTRNSTNTVLVSDGSSWRAGPELPISLNHPGVAAIGNNLYVAGGFTPIGASTRTFVLTAGATSWHEIAPLHRARGALSLLAIGGLLYAIGGRDRSVQVATPERFDPQTGSWSDLPSMPDPRNHTGGFVNAGRACVAGGRTPLTSRRD